MMRMTQTEKVLKYMQERGSITTMDAFRELGITRLSARIYDLKHEGHTIRESSQSGKTKDGTSYTVARYSLGEKEAFHD